MKATVWVYLFLFVGIMSTNTLKLLFVQSHVCEMKRKTGKHVALMIPPSSVISASCNFTAAIQNKCVDVFCSAKIKGDNRRVVLLFKDIE